MSGGADGSVPYPPIGDYALIGDCHGAALVSRTASIDWCCVPRFDRGSCFGRLLDWEGGGHCAIAPLGELQEATRTYLGDTLVLATTLRVPDGEICVIDCLAMCADDIRDPRRQLLRIVEGRRGRVTVDLHVRPRFDYGAVRPWMRRESARVTSAIGGDDALAIACDAELEVVDGHDLRGRAELRANERLRLSLTSIPPELLDEDGALPSPDADELDACLERTLDWWREGSERITFQGPDRQGVLRSALTLEALTYAPTGAIVAAPTTSLPEWLGGDRNWDYRYAWVRDSSYSARSLAELGCEREADRFRRFIQRSAAGHAEDLKILYGIGGERRIGEEELALEGYKGSQPVRVGNGAAQQLQLDAFGELVNIAWRWHRRGSPPDDDGWRFLVSLVDRVCELWREPDAGMWEWRGEPRHFVHSKALCWAALDRGLRLAEASMRSAPVKRWERERAALRTAIETRGYDEERGIFVQAFDRDALDASVLLLPTVELLAWDDERMVRTVRAVREQLGDEDGTFLWRYADGSDGDGREGAFLPCSFWLAECLARQGEPLEARAVFDRAYAAANDLGLLSEEWDPRAPDGGAALGNFPQGLTHLSHVTAALALAEIEA